MQKKGKKVILSVLLAMMMLSTYIIASAAESSEKILENGGHSVYSFGEAVVFIVGDTIEIVPNNDTKMVDVMIDGKVFKGLQRLELKTTERNKVIPEEGSIILQCDSKEQAQELKDKIVAGMENNAPIDSLTELVGEQENIAAYIIDESGKLVDGNGNAVTDSNSPKVEINSLSNAMEEFQEDQMEKQEEMRLQEERERQATEDKDDKPKVDKIIVPPASAKPSTEPSVEPSAAITDDPDPVSMAPVSIAPGNPA